MKMTCRSTLRRTIAVAVSQTAARSPAARARPQRLVFEDGQHLVKRYLTTSPCLDSALYSHPSAASTQDAHHAELARSQTASSKGQQGDDAEAVIRTALHRLPFEKVLRLITPETYSGGYLEAQCLAEVIDGVEEWGDPMLIATGLTRRTLLAYLEYHKVNVGVFLSYRNATLAKSWPDARRHMININDGRWPPLVLQRAILTVSTPSEMSDALAVLQTSIERTRNLTRKGNPSSLKALRYSFAILARVTLKEDGDTLHLLPRLTDLLLALLEGFSAQLQSPGELINDFARRCTGLRDERARQAITRVLDWLESQQNTDAFEKVRYNVIAHCITSIESAMTSSKDKSAAAEQMADIELMEYLLRQNYGADSDLRQRALRCSVFVAGHARDYRRTWQSFNEYQEYKHKHGSAMVWTDYQLLAKALVRSEQGRKDAWHVFLQAERLLRRQPQNALDRKNNERQNRRWKRELEAACVDLLQVMASSPDIRVEQVFSMLGISLKGFDQPESMPFVKGKSFSGMMLRRRTDVRAYAVVMQGLLMRRRPKYALTIWQAMLQRGVMPNAIILSLLLQHLFQMGDVKSAMQQLHLWCEQGVPKPTGPRHHLKDLEVSSLSTSKVADTDVLLSSTLLDETSQNTERHIVTPDVVLATVIFNGLHRCGSPGVEALWEAYRLTIKRFPDAPVLAMLLKASCHDEAKSNMDANFGRQVFRSMLFRKHPELADYRNPLNEQLESNSSAGWIFSNDTVGSRMEDWLTSVFQPKQVASAASPVNMGDVKALVFTSKLFEHYLRLVLHLQHASGVSSGARSSRQELVDLLGWMKELHVTPSTTHLALTALEIEEHLPPAVAARQMEALDQWLIEWLGERALPQDEVMQRHWQWKIKRNGQRKGWFDRVAGPRETAVQGEVDRHQPN